MELALPPGPTAVREARSAVRTWLGERRTADPDLLGDIVLSVSELTTNAVVHGLPPVWLGLRLSGSTLRVEVHDGSPDPPIPVVDADAMATRGRGMAIIAATADRYGVDPDHGGKIVWAEFDLPITA